MSDLVEASRDKAERAYAIWSTDGGADIEKTAALCGIPVRTLCYYKRRDHWEGRLELERHGDTQSAVTLAAQMVRAAMPRVVEKLQWICFGDKPLIDPHTGTLQLDPETGKPIMVPAADNKDALQAGRWLLQYGFLSAGEVLRGEHELPYPITNDGRSAGVAGTPNSAREQARDILNANYQAANTRRSPGKRR
jgi:hypothetical protein